MLNRTVNDDFLYNLKGIIKKNVFLKPLYDYSVKLRILKQNYIFRKNAHMVLRKFKAIMETNNIFFWLEFGTLLGAYREKDFIAHDLDIDIGLFIDNDKDKIERALISGGFKKLQEITIDDGKYGLEQSYLYKGVKIDLFYFTIKNDEMYCHTFKASENKTWNETILEKGGLVIQEHVFPYHGFITMEFKGMTFNVPNEIEKHLSANYGKNFMIKDPNWNYSKNDRVKILEGKTGKVLK